MNNTIVIGTLRLRRVDLLGEMTYEQQLYYLFPADNYTPLARWMETPAGKAAIPDYHQLSWAERAEALNQIVPWTVERHQLMKSTNRLSKKS